MARKIKLTRPELKRQRDALARFERYLPMLKLKQQQLQMTVLQTLGAHRRALAAVADAQVQADAFAPLLADLTGINVRQLSRPEQVVTHEQNIAGVRLPVFDEAKFGPLAYSLFATPPWVDEAIARLRQLNQLRAEAEVLSEQLRLLRLELTRVMQRVNLFEKVMIPRAKEAIRVIRIKLGYEQTSAVGRAKIAKSKLVEVQVASAQTQRQEVPA